MDSYALGDLAYTLGISHGRLHRALEDARVCHRLYLALVRKALDMGFQGIKKNIKNGNEIFMPKKKPKGGELTPAEKEENKIISSIRITVEHAIGGLKRFRCLTDLYRNKNGIDDKFISICAGLWNFHLQPV